MKLPPPRSLMLSLMSLPAFCSLACAEPSKVDLVQDAAGAWQMLLNGEPFEVRGVARDTYMDLAREIGANTIRTYWSPAVGEDHDRLREAMDEAYKKGLYTIRGLTVGKEGKDFSYDNAEQLAAQRERIRAEVRAWKDHPGLLMWGLSNESEGHAPKASFWREMDVLARIIKSEDPGHPVMTVTAGSPKNKLEGIIAHYPSIDIIGVNTYGGAPTLPERLDVGEWGKPFMLTEFGPRGHWEVPKTPWNAPVEPDSEDKAELYSRGYLGSKADPSGRFLGSVCFVWGQKQEVTGTWYGMFLETGEKTPAVDHIAHVYGGKWPANRSPRINSLDSGLALKVVAPGATFTATVHADDREGDPLSYEWKVMEERKGRWGGGAVEPVPPTVDGAILDTPSHPRDQATVTVRTPDKPGAYRLFVFVRDGQGGAATQNLPFYVEMPQP